MQTTNDKKELAVGVCPDCGMHTVLDPAWLQIEGDTLSYDCDNCCGDPKEHTVVRFVAALTLN